MFDGHINYRIRFVAIGDEVDGLSFRLGVLDELLEPSLLGEELDCIFKLDAIVSNVLVALVEPTIFCFVDPFPLFRCNLEEVRSFLEQWLQGMTPSLVVSLKE